MKYFTSHLLRKIFASVFAGAVLVSFIFTPPSSSVRDALMNIQIQQIEAANQLSSSSGQDTTPQHRNLFSMNKNNQIVFAVDDCSGGGPGCTGICCRNATPGPGEYCNDFLCPPEPTHICCEGGVTPGPDEVCDSTKCIAKTQVCCDEFADNPFTGPLGPNEECSDSACTYTYIYYCCDPLAKNYTAPEDMDPIYGVCGGTCNMPRTVCCDPNWDNYVSPANRHGDNCEYQPPTCACDIFSSTHQSQCGGNGNGTSTATTTPSCAVSTSFSTLKSGVSIGGTASALINPVSCDPISDASCDPATQTKCDVTSTDAAFLANAAAAAAGPETPLNVPQSLGAFSTYTVTSKDFCQNISGDQDSTDYNRDNEGFCCQKPASIFENNGTKECKISPTCGDATLTPTDTAPSSNLCSSGSASTVTNTTNTFNWSCTNGTDTTNCSVTRTCNGGDCTQEIDLCENVAGVQSTTQEVDDLGYAIYSGKECWNKYSGACGPVMTTGVKLKATINNSTAGLCQSNSYVTNSNMPQANTDQGTGRTTYSWTCSTSLSGVINPSCSAQMCLGTECSTSGIIRYFRAIPSLVANENGVCNLTWETTNDADTEGNISDVCTLNNTAVSDDNTAPYSVPPGSYNLKCTNGETHQTQSVKCVVKPDYKEI